MIEIIKTDSTNKDFKILISQLDSELRERYGEVQNEYDQYNIIEFNEDVLVAYDDKVPVACGCFKEFDGESVEIKRMFVRKDFRGKGISKAVLETGIKQEEAIGLYLKNGYKKIKNYGQYAGLPMSVCFSKALNS